MQGEARIAGRSQGQLVVPCFFDRHQKNLFKLLRQSRDVPRSAFAVAALQPFHNGPLWVGSPGSARRRMTNTEKLLRDLIALPSVNPAFLAANDPRGGEKRVAEFLAHKAKQNRLDVEFQDVLPNRSNLLARLSPTGRVRRRILLAPHLDTVNVVSEAQFTPMARSEKLFGRGACDTKGSVAAMFNALCELARSDRRPRETEIIFAGLVDEENAQTGSRALADSSLKADLAIVGEATRLQVITAHKGSLWLELETLGKAAHGARPELGRNAVHEMARIVDLLQTRYATQLRQRPRHRLLGHATVSVGAISGGTQANIVPDRCTAL